MKTTDYAGIDYARGTTANRNPATGIHYGVISQHSVGQWWYDESQPWYGSQEGESFECKECGEDTIAPTGSQCGESVKCSNPGCGCEIEPLDNMMEPISHFIDDAEYSAECHESDICITRSPYFTHAQFCSPCRPGAGNLDSPCESGPRSYCFGHDCFESGVAPYPVYSVATGELIPAPVN